MKTYITIFFILVGVQNSFSQLSLFAKVEYNHFQMMDLKEYQNELLAGIVGGGIPAKITENYPPYIGYQIGFKIPAEENIYVGGFGGYTSTGSRIHYQDYSGELINDQIASAYTFAGILGTKQLLFENLSLDLSLSLELIISSWDNKSTLTLGDSTQQVNLEFGSLSFSIEPTVTPTYSFKNMNIGLSASYLLCIPTSLEYSSISDAYLIHRNKNRVLIDWSGYRIGLIIGYVF